jgi:hypothetical protein
MSITTVPTSMRLVLTPIDARSGNGEESPACEVMNPDERSVDSVLLGGDCELHGLPKRHRPCASSSRPDARHQGRESRSASGAPKRHQRYCSLRNRRVIPAAGSHRLFRQFGVRGVGPIRVTA